MAAAIAAGSTASDAAAAFSASSGMPHPVVSIQLSNLPAMLAVIRSQLMSKQPILQLSAEERQFLAVLTLQAFLKGLRRPGGPSSTFASNIRIHELPVGMSGGIMRSSIVEGAVIDIPLPIHRTIHALCAPSSPQPASSSSLRKYVHLRVIIYNINLTFAESEHMDADLTLNHNIAEDDNDDADDNEAVDQPKGKGKSYQQSLYGLMRGLVDRWSSLGVTLVCAQKVMHPYLKQCCLERGMLPLERLSIRHVHAVHQVAGGEVLSGIGEQLVRPQAVGTLAALEEKVIARRRYLFLTPEPPNATTSTSAAAAATAAAGVSTFLLSCPTLAQQGELSALLTRIFKILTNLLRVPVVCAGAGATELQLAAEIRRNVEWMRQQKRSKHERMRQEDEKLAASKAALVAVSHPLDSSADAAAADLSELAALDGRLRGLHSSRVAAHDRMLGDACLQVADVLEDVALYAPWNSTAAAAAGGVSTRIMLQEIKQRFRQYQQQPSQAESSAEPSVLPADSASSTSPPRAAAVAASCLPLPDSVASSDSLVDSAAAVQRLASQPDSDPLPTPQWHVRDWQLDFEGRSSVATTTAPLSANSAPRSSSSSLPPPLVLEPHALYGVHPHHASPTVVFRTTPSSSSSDGGRPQQQPQPRQQLLLDSASVLDPLYVKRACLQMAIEAASALLRVDQIVHSSV